LTTFELSRRNVGVRRTDAVTSYLPIYSITITHMFRGGILLYSTHQQYHSFIRGSTRPRALEMARRFFRPFTARTTFGRT
jgi:hypothetical protein